MEKIKVNMSPNPLDIQTIHCSQGDTEAREWEFELHNNGEVIDSSSISDQLVFKAYEGGTEEILPTNGSTPTTSPFNGDIKYPQGLLTDQEFLYRQSPTEEDGFAKITDIKGNTLVWNQLVNNGNFASVTGWATSGRGTITVANNIATIVPNRSGLIVTGPVINISAGHKYLLSVELKAESTSVWVGAQYNDVHARLYSNGTNEWQRMASIISNFANDSQSAPVFGDDRPSGWTSSQLRNFMFIDLTKMFGAGNEPTTVEEFTALFPLPYYDYNQGTLLSFNGNGIKTVGKNLFNQEWESGSIDNTTGEPIANAYIDRFKDYIRVFPNTRYYYWYEDIGNNMPIYYYDGDKNYLGRIIAYSGNAFVTPSDCCFIRGAIANGQGLPKTLIQKDGAEREYEPYTSTTTDLPISTYFPTGMKSAGSVYDELTESKATKKLELFEITSANIKSSYLDTQNNQWLGFVSVPNIKQITNEVIKANILCNTLETKNQGSLFGEVGNAIALLVNSTNVRITIKGITTFADMQTWLDNNPTYFIYELATPTETSFTTASLVTENAEIPLSNEDGVLIGECTEQLSAEPGFHDAKIKLADEDGECYSNKIQLHIERSPQ